MIQAGQVYKHSKGTHYMVICNTKDSETLEPRVVYQALNDSEVWDRPARMWEELVLWSDGVMRPRFVLV